MLSLRSAKISRSERGSLRAPDSWRDRHFMGRYATSGCRFVLQHPVELTAYHNLHSGELHARHSPREAGFSHLLEHFFHLRILPEQIVDFLYAGAGAARDSFATTAVNRFVMIAFVSSHRVDDGLNAIDLFFVNLVGGFLQARKSTHTGQHPHEAL